ncbi:4'-phosphopantetheinyl transferase superfamily protein [Streptomyces sp. NPDC048258]|uniref:4'-phosphopantetheinyl transferase superfamily protein n=1 Tax=Streptomyces sp. NPDC048258 TaxID=3365527 RepID=UPI003711C4F2
MDLTVAADRAVFGDPLTGDGPVGVPGPDVIDVPGAGVLTLAFARLDEHAELFAGERALLDLECRTPARRREFAAGRLAARRAVAALGGRPGPVLRAGCRPLFAPAVEGSLSHSGGWAVAAVGPGRRFAGVGVDLETGASRPVLGPRTARLFCSPDDDASDLLALFSAKESVYKAWGGQAPDGGELRLPRIVCTAAPHGFTARVADEPPLHVRVLRGLDGSVLTATARPATRATGPAARRAARVEDPLPHD